MKWIVKLKSRGVDIEQDKPQSIWQWPYPSSAVVSGEVKDGASIAKGFFEFATNIRKKLPKIVLILDDEIVFFKTVQSEVEYQQFLEMVPIDPGQMLKKKVTLTDGRTLVWVANRNLVDAVRKGIEDAGGRIDGLWAASMVNDKYLRRVGNFLVGEVVTGVKKDRTWMWLVWVIAIMVWIGIVGVVVWRYLG